MKQEAMKELRTKTVPELEQLVAGYRRELLDGKNREATEGEGLGPRAGHLRRDIARCLTLITEKRRSEATR